MDLSGSHSRLFSGLTVIGAVNIIGALSNPFPIYTVVQHWLLATNCDCNAIGLLLSRHSCTKIDNQCMYVHG